MAKRKVTRRHRAEKAGKKKAARRSMKVKKSVKRSVKKREKVSRPAKPKRPAVARVMSAPPKPAQAAGPKRLLPKEKHVHLIYVAAETVACASPGHPTDSELDQLGAFVGRPAPTDVIVFLGEPYQMPTNRPPMAHPGVHQFRETVLMIHGGASPVWWSEEPFIITQLAQDDLPNFKHASTDPTALPFAVPLPAVPEGDLYVARATPPDPGSHGHQWKITFEMDGHTVDPHMDT